MQMASLLRLFASCSLIFKITDTIWLRAFLSKYRRAPNTIMTLSLEVFTRFPVRVAFLLRNISFLVLLRSGLIQSYAIFAAASDAHPTPNESYRRCGAAGSLAYCVVG